MKVRSFKRALALFVLMGLAVVIAVSKGKNVWAAYGAEEPAYVYADVSAATLYVDGSIGVNQCSTYDPATRSCGSGSTTAYRTIGGAAAAVTPGITVLIQPGTYAGGITVDTSGTSVAPITFRANGAGVVINGSGGERDAFFITWADYIVVEGLTIQNATRAAVRIDNAHHVTVRNSTLANNGTWGLFTDFSDYTTVENSEAYGSVDEHGIYISNSSDYPVIRGNRLHHNHNCGLHMNGDASMGGDGIISHALVENNVIYENGLNGGSGINLDGVTDSVVRNNLLYDNHANGISLYQIDGGSGSINNRVLHNTFIMAANGRWGINIDEVSTGNKVLNNIVLNKDSWRGSIMIATPALAGFESNYNVIMDRLSTDSGDTVISLAQWRALGYDHDSLIATADQLFVNPVVNNYHLKTGSPALDRGTSLPDVPADLEGQPRPQGSGWDIGAFEFQPAIKLNGAPANQTIYLNWTANVTLPSTGTWRLAYYSQTVPIMINNILSPTRVYSLTGLTNYAWYTVTLNAMLESSPFLTDTIKLMPTDRLVYLPIVLRSQ
ncbi:MAG TPA: right-handed parallel beta-helix repeat-containing protein [Anaerolineae bacterium]|nr:right-handed parallel beta-helix repeat-containing protein [Anaerolineae bacterium]